MDQFSLKGKKILITGASSGIGRQVAISASEQDATLIITGRNQPRLDETFKMLNGEGHLQIIADLTDPDQVASLTGQLPVIDGLVFSAGITSHMPVKFIRDEDISQVFKINYESAVMTVGSLLRKKKIADHASLVFLSSTATRFTYFGGTAYSGSKAALEAYSRNLAVELAPKGIRSNCLLPSFVNTPMVEGAGNTISKEVLERFEKMSPLGFGDPRDVANAAIFYLSGASRWITGSDLVMGAIL